DRLAIVAAQMEQAHLRRAQCTRRTIAGRLAIYGGMVMEHRKTVAAVDHEVNLDTGAEPHAFEDAPAGEHRIGGAAAGAVPLEVGAVTVAGHRYRIAHIAAWDRKMTALSR